MYMTSSQCKHWLFHNEEELEILRKQAYDKYMEKAQQNSRGNENRTPHYLNYSEEVLLRKQYEFYLREFCRKFHPPMPKCVVATSFQYFKRFYLHNSVMDYHPYEVLLTCVYLAAKVEEFNIGIVQFVSNLKRDREKFADIILNTELLLMQQLNYHLTVHNPFRPVEGFLIDLKTRCPFIDDPESFRPAIDEFLDRSLYSDVCLLFPPSQLALAAIFQAASLSQKDINKYLPEVLLGPHNKDKTGPLIKNVSSIREMVQIVELPNSPNIKNIEKKLDKCRNPENNPESQVYKRKMQEMLDEEEGKSARKYARVAEEQRMADELLLGISDKT